nr:hypothetical protein [Tanacetum cinerariifolium]
MPMKNGNTQFKTNVVKKISQGVMHKDTGVYGQSNSYAHAVKIGPYYPSVVEDNKPASVLGDSCTLQSDLSLSVVGKLKKFDYLSNLKTLLAEKGFVDIIIRYMGGFWVLFQFTSKVKKYKFMTHVGVSSWFTTIQQASSSFKIDERGSLLYDEDKEAPYFHRKRLCIKTNFENNIFETFKIIIKGKFFWIRAKEVTGWSPNFNDGDDDLSDSDDESLVVKNDEIQNNETSEVNSEVEEIPETIFEQGEIKSTATKGKHKDEGESKYPPGFTPRDASEVNSNMEQKPVRENNDCNQKSHKLSNMKKDSNASLKEDADASVCSGNFKSVKIPKSGGFILQLMLDLIKVGETMGYKMNGCINNFEEIVKTQGAQNPSVGNSRGILCVWDPYMFRREHSTVSDYFIAIMGKWSSNDKNLIIISVYAPQELSEKKMLWQYLNHMIHRWKGDVIVMGDFNVVRTQEERFGSIFNPQGAATFNSFISSGGLVEVSSGGYSFTWSHKSASKMIYPQYGLSLDTKDLDQVLAFVQEFERSDLMKLGNKVFSITYLVAYALTFSHHSIDYRKKEYIEIDDLFNEIGSVEGSKFAAIKPIDESWAIDIAKNKRLIGEEPSRSFVHVKRNKLRIRETSSSDIRQSMSPDGFTFSFYQKYWSLLKPDVVDAANHFYTHGFCPNGALENLDSLELTQKAKVKWSIEGDENSRYLQVSSIKKRNKLATRDILVEGAWIEDPK